MHGVPTMGHLRNPETKAVSVSRCDPLLVTLGGGVERGTLFTQAVTHPHPQDLCLERRRGWWGGVVPRLRAQRPWRARLFPL